MNSTRLVLLTALLLAFSGCLSNDGAGDGNGGVDGNGTADGGEGGEVAEPVLTDHTCHVDAGAVVVSSTSPAGNYGGCNLVDLASDQTYHANDIPGGCRVEVDLDGDDMADEEATLGKTYASGASFVAFCDPGVVNVDVTITLAA